MKPEQNLPIDVLGAIHSNRKILAIKVLRENRDIGLRDAKKVVDSYILTNPHVITRNSSSGFTVFLLFFVANGTPIAILSVAYCMFAWKF